MNARAKAKNWLEWTVFTIGLVLVTSLVGYLAYDMATTRSGPPSVQVQLGVAQQRSGHYAVPVAVKNHGQQTAHQVQVEVELTGNDGETEKAHFEVQFLPRGATRHGTVTFQSNPWSAKRLTGRAVGYELP